MHQLGGVLRIGHPKTLAFLGVEPYRHSQHSSRCELATTPSGGRIPRGLVYAVSLTVRTRNGASMTIPSALSAPHRTRAVSIATIFGLLTATLVLGVAAPANAALPPAQAVVGMTGSRPSATQIPFSISDQVSAAVDVATGNLTVSNSSLSLRGVTGDVAISQTYNLMGAPIGSTTVPSAKNWTVGIDGVGYLSQGTGSVVYTTGDGSTWAFTPVSGSTTAFTSPAGFKQDLVASATNYTLTNRISRQVVTFNLNGQPTSIADRNGNATTIAYTGANPTSVVSSAGPVAARTASLSYNSTTFTLTVSQSSGTLSRNIKYVKNSASNLVSIVDALGKTTTFTYSGTRIATITAPTGQVTTFTYGTTGKVERVAQANTSTGSPGTSTTRISYPSATQTLVAGPNTDQALAITAVPRTTYTVDSASKLVTAATDPMERNRAATYTANADVFTATSGAGATAGTSTAEYGANNGESATKTTSPGGASKSAAYTNTAAATKYLPSSTTDDGANSTTFTYNGSGNALTSTNALAATATLTYNTNGTIATATAPGNGTNKTVYAHNTNNQLSTVTPVTGAGLVARTFTYDDFGRTKTATNGRNQTITYGYDLQDRLLTTAFSEGTATVVNSYTDTGLLASRQDANGITQYSYDRLSRLTSRQNSFAGGIINYSYDRASNLTTVIDSRGTTTNAFDASGVPTQITYKKGTGTQILGFTTDNRGRRTDSYLATNAARTVWAAHTHNDYDTSGRVSRVIAELGPATGPTITMDTSYCYNNATPAPLCSAGISGDRSRLQWSINNLTGQITTYTYDGGGAITQVAQSGGTAPNSTWAYTYDSRGNRLTATTTGATTASQTFTANPANHISNTGYEYDGGGNLITDPDGTYSYNGADQMKVVNKAGATNFYRYAGASQNEVLEQEKSGVTYQLVYGRKDQQGQPVVEQVKITNSSGTNTAYLENDPVTGEPLILRTSSGNADLYVYSGTGNPVALLTDFFTETFAYTYDPYGVPISTSGGTGIAIQQNPFLFAGGIQDRATGWIKFGARWYNPATGRWTQQDTLDNPLNPKNANRYAYAGNDPVNNQDPSGRSIDNFDLEAVNRGTAAAFAGGLVSGCIGGAFFGGVGCFPGALATGALGIVGGLVGGSVNELLKP